MYYDLLFFRWDPGYNSLFDCTRSEITIEIPRSIADGVAQDTRSWNDELEEYEFSGTTIARNEPSVVVEVHATAPSGWFMPLAGNIDFKGRHDVVFRDVNLSTNGGKISVLQTAAWAVRTNATGGGINGTLISTGHFDVSAQADIVYGGLLPTRSVDVGEISLEYIDLELWNLNSLLQEYTSDGTLFKGYKSRATGDIRRVYDGDDAGAKSLGLLHIRTENAAVKIDRIVHGNITIVMDGSRRHSTGVDMNGVEGDIHLKLNAFEYQGTYDLRTDAGDVQISDGGCNSIVQVSSSGNDADTDEPSSKSGRIGNVRDMRTYEPMSRRVRVHAAVASFGEASIDVEIDCANYRRCELDCSWRGICNPDSGTCTCDTEHFYNHSTRYYGGGCQFSYCPNDCSGKGVCDSASGNCTCVDRWYPATDYFPCTQIHCDDGTTCIVDAMWCL